MVDFIEYVVGELKSKRLSKTDAVALVRQFSVRPAAAGNGASIHPLLQRNTSDLQGQRYASTFTGDEFFLRDHQLKPAGEAAHKVLPGVAYLEMARAAIEHALPAWPQSTVLEIRNTVWAQPIVVAGKKEVSIALIPGDDDAIDYEIYSGDGDDEVVHCQGRVVLDGKPLPKIDPASLERQMSNGVLGAGAVYDACARFGLVYGPSMQAIETIQRGEGQLLARLRIPAAVVDKTPDYALHPSIMDGALQAAIGLFDTTVESSPRLPFALDALRVAAPCSSEMFAWVRYASGSGPADAVTRLDIDLCDEQGNVRVQMHGMSWRELGRREEAGTVFAVPVWQESAGSGAAPAFAQQHVVVCERALDGNLAEHYTEQAVACFEQIQEILRAKPAGKVLFRIVVADDPEQSVLSGLSALLQTAALENPQFVGQLIVVPANASREEIERIVSEERGVDPYVRYCGGLRQVLRWQEVAQGSDAAPIGFRDDGVYLITGGAGGLGTLFANEILARTTNARIVLAGRSESDAARDPRVTYRSVDLRDLQQVEQLIAAIQQQHGRLDGILHCAGVIADDFILRKSASQFRDVLAPKVTGTVHLDLATRDVPLDFFALFSAIGGATGNAGQADYATANAFLDRFASYRNAQVAAGTRHGRTRSINWPLWAAGGMRIEAADQERLERATGMRAMQTATGLDAFYRCVAAPHDQTLVMEGDVAQIRRFLARTTPEIAASQPAAVAVDAEKPEEFLRRQFSAVLKVPAQQLDPRAPLENYGIDSIVAMKLTNQLETTFGSLPKTLFFEYQTIRDLANYFAQHHAAKLAAPAPEPAAPVLAAPRTAPRKLASNRRFARTRNAAPETQFQAEPIAIVGLSGRYPEAVDVEAYWRNLRDGKDCITEVPKQRWDWREYFSDDRTKSGHHYSKWGGFIEGVDEFDPLFFNISPVEAEQMDPQERLFLQHAWMAIEDAGYTRAALQLPDANDLPGQVGVYVGLMYTEYQMLGAAALAQGRRIGVASSAGSIANRVSYLLNLHGPSMTLDTMCSSSLSAIHLACQDLKAGRTTLAIAGGVNVTIHPNKYFVLSSGQFISSDGHCQSFGEGGDGYIPGEGVGVVVLKRLSDAQRDGDHIYGVIRGSALNHGGKTNGYTVPNPQAQASVIRRALAESGVDARHISYIEAHGTGTKLGDPIEIAALSKAFGTEDTGYCLIGSAKSNIGHCESAAGIAGLTKVLLQMQHRQIVPSLHSAQLNPHIDFDKTPFIVNQALRPWEPEVDGRPIPRIAGISSFGAGGSNAHIVIEEYQAPAAQPLAYTEVAIVLSARTPEQLRQKAIDLAAFVRARQQTIDLAALAYTLQVGREPMEERLGFLASSTGQLLEILDAYAAGAETNADVFAGNVKRNREALALFSTDSDLQQTIEKWIANKKVAKLLDLWVKGLSVDWTRLWSAAPAAAFESGSAAAALHRISLPVYPFARERYWLDTSSLEATSAAAVLHPLLHSNTSDLIEQRFSSTFHGGEFFLADHQVSGQKILPAVAYLEMARAAIERAWPAPADAAVLELRNTAWAQPVIVNGSTQVDVALVVTDDDEVDYEIYSGDTVHCQGRAVWSAQHTAARIELETLERRMTRGELDAERLYAALAEIGLAYGPSFRAVTKIARGNNEVLARLRLPSPADAQDYVLHPSVMDAALQAAVGLLQDDERIPLRLPFALQTLRVLWPCSRDMVAWVRMAADSDLVDVDLCDERGVVCVQMHGFATRALHEHGRLLAAPEWQAREIATTAAPEYAEEHVVVCEGGEGRDIAQRYTEFAVACFERIQDILQRRPDGHVLMQVVVPEDGEPMLFAGLAALLETARLESSHFLGQLIVVPQASSAEERRRLLERERSAAAETLVRYERGARYVRRWKEIAADRESAPAFKDDGVYLITGGLGALGLLFAKDILDNTRAARIVLTGRAPWDESIAARLPDARASYRQVDLADGAQVERLIASVVSEHGRLDGIVHSAGMIADRLIVKKSAAEFRDVLAPKVAGTFHLDHATRDLPLDFFVLFSSIAAAKGNIGQADYATANAYMDQFAAHRNRLAAQGLRHGRTRSINWPLWQAGGMTIDPAGQELLERTIGIKPLRTAAGLDAFRRSLASDCDQLLVAEGDVAKLRRALLAEPAAPLTVAPEPVSVASENLLEKTQEFLRREFSGVLKLPAHKLDPQAPLENYGIDSVHAMRLTNELEKTFGSLSKTLFFEYQTIAAMAAYFAKAHHAVLREKLGIAGESARPKVAAAAVTERKRRSKRKAVAQAKSESDIAIVGVAGKYPQAENLAEFWRNLQSGRDCITEIPPDRWDHDQYFDPDQNTPGKTYSKWGGFVSDVDKFDPLFFNISPKEAAMTDPQERLFLQTAWETIEDAGYSKERVTGTRTGVFVGAMWGHYELFGAESIARGEPVVPISSHASIANRVSYFFDFRGPSIALDTMCSSSLTAIHLACGELRKGAIDAAIAGGVNLTLHPYKYLSLSQGKFVATDGRCRSFGAGGDGYVPGEGVGAVMLKRLDDAVRDGDRILAVIKSSTLNHGGKTNGYTVPNPVAQGDLIVEALRAAKIDPQSLGYIETHGTGTSLGDPIEITGLLKAFDGAAGKQFCPIGSVKSNIGHLESAAGIAAVTKALLQLRHKQLVPSLHAESLNPNIDFANSPFYVQTRLADWKRNPAHPRRIAVSSFGAGGSNAHLILEEYERAAIAATTASAEIFVLSAKNADALDRYAGRVLQFLEDNPEVPLSALAYTSQVGRTAMDVRIAVIASSVNDVARALGEWLRVRKSGGDVSDLANVFYGNSRDAAFSAAGVIDGEAGKAFLRNLLSTGDLHKIARLWTLGVDVDWSVLDRPAGIVRVSLPTYPFAKERCWIPVAAPKARIERPAEESKRALYYAPRWVSKPLHAVEERQTGPIVVLDETDRVFLALREQRGEDSVVWVRPGDTFGEVEPNVYVVDPEREEHFHELFASLQGKAFAPTVIVHHAPDPCNLVVNPDVARELSHTLYSLFFFCKAMLRSGQQAPPRIVSVYSNDADATPPLGGAVAGFLKTLTLEDPRYAAKAIEVPGELSAAERVALILEEIRERDSTAQEIRYAQGLTRFARQLSPLSAPNAAAADLPMRHNGVYLMTGGLGGLGLIFARDLAKKFRPRLVLVGRSAPTAAQLQQIGELEAGGAEVLCVQGDVSQLRDVETVVREAKARFGEIHGVIHAAGVHRDAFILKKTREEMEAVLAPKIYGTINVDLATRGEPLDFFVLFSSVAGVLGNVGQSDYAYANHFLDSFAARREHLRNAEQRPGRTLSINWPLWQDGGMSLPADGIALLEKRAGISPLPARDGIQCWEDFLRSGATQAVALYGSPSRIAAFIEQKPAEARRTTVTRSVAVNGASLIAQTEAYVRKLIGAEIGLDPERIESSDRLQSFGIDSIMINRINAQLERDLGALPKTLLYEHETAGDVAKFLVQQAREALIALFGSDDAAGEVVIEEIITPSMATVVEAREAVEEIAIIGMHARLPHAATLEEFWEHLREGHDVIDPVPADRWDAGELYDPNPAAVSDGKIYCKWGGFLEDHDKFDPRFFHISTAEARLVDPQERLFLESVWAAIEDAGYTRDRLRTRYPKAQSADVGVFVGVTTNSYHLLEPEERLRGNFVTPSAMPWSIANRVSYFFDFSGPSLPVDTACSSSMLAIQLAAESLRRGECQLAIAGGVNLYLHPSKYQGLCQRRALSTDGKCRSYGAGGEGFVPAEGVGALVLKPLRKAIEDGDRIHAVVRAAASEHSGRSNGYSAPNPNAQANLISRTLEKAGIEPESIDYVEGHGTGSQLGDAVEIAALTQAFQKQTAKTQFCAIGSVKANMGHAESAAGIAAVAKVVLQMQHRQLAPTLHADEPNPNIQFADSPFYLQRGLSEWTSSGDRPRRALINAFGAGGVNACLVIEEHNAPVPAVEAGPCVFTLSAKNEERLRDYAERMLAHLKRQPRSSLASVCYSLQIGREAMEERLATVVSSIDQLVERLSEWMKRGAADGVHRGSLAPRRGGRRMTKAAEPGMGEHGLIDLASRWVSGEDVDWQNLYAVRPSVVTLPTYPFARERYWVNESAAAEKPARRAGQLHPLVGFNSSTLQEVSFSSVLSNDAFYAVDHKVHDESIFPGAGFLEMACVAATIAGEQRVRKITGIVWAHPLSFRAGAQSVRTTLRQNGSGIEYEISSLDDDNEKIVHSEGKLVLGNGSLRAAGEDRILIDALKEQSAPFAQLYDTFRTYGLHYGPSFRSVQELRVNGTFALAKLKLAEHLKSEFGQFILHPAIIDGALQTIAGLAGGDAATVYLPFAVDEIELIRPVSQTCYAYAERADAQKPGRAGVARFNIRLLSERGDVLVRMNNLYVRPFASPVTESPSAFTSPPAGRGRLISMTGESIH